MAPVHELRTYTPAGVLTGVITNFLSVAYVKGVNEPGMLQFVLNGDHASIDDFELDAQVEVWRKDLEAGIASYCDFYGLWRGAQRRASSDGITTYTAYCPGQMSLLDRSIVAYYAGVDGRSSFTNDPAETIAKALVTYNATGAGTTADGRMRTVTLTGITVAANTAAGDSIDFACAWRKLLPSLQEVSQVGGGDFDLVKTAAAAWEFRWYDGQLGTDRSATVTFALQYGNMANPTLIQNSINERTVAIVGGQGEEDSREIAVRTGTNYAAAVNSVEMFVDARELTVTASLNAKGDRELDTYRRRDELVFDVLQVPSTRYGEHYTLGDLVTGYYQSVTSTKKIQRVNVSVDEGGQEQIKVELADV